MNSIAEKLWKAEQHMVEAFVGRLPAFAVAVVVFIRFYCLSLIVDSVIGKSIPKHRQNLGVVFARLLGGATIFLAVLVAFSIVAPFFSSLGSDQGAWNRRCGNWLCLSEHTAKFPGRSFAAVG